MVVVASYQIMIEEIKILIENRCSFTHEQSKYGIDRGKKGKGKMKEKY